MPIIKFRIRYLKCCYYHCQYWQLEDSFPFHCQVYLKCNLFLHWFPNNNSYCNNKMRLPILVIFSIAEYLWEGKSVVHMDRYNLLNSILTATCLWESVLRFNVFTKAVWGQSYKFDSLLRCHYGSLHLTEWLTFRKLCSNAFHECWWSV